MNMRKKQFSSFIVHPSSFSQGFTLIEIMLVIVIILIATGVSVPMFRGTFKSTQMTDASRSVIRITRFARSLAILRQADCTLEFTDTQMILTCSAPGEPQTSRRFPEDITIQEFETESEEPDEGDPKKIVFYASGMNDGYTLTIGDDKDRKKTLTCHPISGKVMIEEK